MPRVRVNGAWRDVSSIYVKVSGAWRRIVTGERVASLEIDLPSGAAVYDGISNDGVSLYVLSRNASGSTVEITNYSTNGTVISSLSGSLQSATGLVTVGQTHYVFARSGSNNAIRTVAVNSSGPVTFATLNNNVFFAGKEPATDGTSIYLCQGTSTSGVFLYALSPSTGNRESSSDIDNVDVTATFPFGSFFASGLGYWDSRFYIAQARIISTVNASDGSFVTGSTFQLHADNTDVRGITIINGIVYVLDSGADKIFAYRL